MKPFTFGLLLIASVAQAARHRASAPPQFPQCRMVQGMSAVTFTRDGGATVAPRAQALHGIGYTYGVAALDRQTILAAHNDAVFISHDAGCSWQPAGRVTGPDLFPPSITAAPDGGAYIWSDNREILARYDASGLKTLKPPAAIVGFGVDATLARIADTNGTIWTSTDRGESWQRTGPPPPITNTLVYRGAFDRTNLDHALVGSAVFGAFVTFDGGRNWQQSAGLGKNFSVFNIVISPADPNVVWAMALDTAAESRHIFRSTDGGRSFAAAVDASEVVTLVNGPVMAAHPSDPNVLYFVFGTYFQDYGTDLFRYDAATRELRLMHHDFDDIDAIAFSPADPSVMYFGLEVVEPNAP
jgi:photosystem II stability/assembly factor-like uncharacterized protein